MGINHFENGKNVTLQHVNIGVKVEDILTGQYLGTAYTKTFTVPAGKKWTIYRVVGERSLPGDIKISITDPLGSYADVKIEYAALNIFLEQPLTITSGWVITIQFYTGANAIMYCSVLYTEEAE